MCIIYFPVVTRRLHWKHNKKEHKEIKDKSLTHKSQNNSYLIESKIELHNNMRINFRKPFIESKNKLHNDIIRTNFIKPFLDFRTVSRDYSTLSHVDETGKFNMVDVGSKEITKRIAKAQGYIYVGSTIAKLINENGIKKGNVLSVAQLAGIMAAKRTSDLIPLCHSLSITYVNVWLKLNDDLERVEILSEVRCLGKTGVEMEALTAVSVAALTIYDMCKSAGPPDTMKISGIELVSKSGGKSNFIRENSRSKSQNK